VWVHHSLILQRGRRKEMSDDIDKHVLKRYEIATKLGKGV
jgi:hypothetical protein